MHSWAPCIPLSSVWAHAVILSQWWAELLLGLTQFLEQSHKSLSYYHTHCVYHDSPALSTPVVYECVPGQPSPLQWYISVYQASPLHSNGIWMCTRPALSTPMVYKCVPGQPSPLQWCIRPSHCDIIDIKLHQATMCCWSQAAGPKCQTLEWWSFMMWTPSTL